MEDEAVAVAVVIPWGENWGVKYQYPHDELVYAFPVGTASEAALVAFWSNGCRLQLYERLRRMT